MAKYQYYFFDLDGTLINSERGITNSVKYILEKYRIKEHDIYGAGKNALDSIGVLFGFGSWTELEEAGADYIVGTPEEIMDI